MMRFLFYISCFLVPWFAFILARMLVVVADAFMGNINLFLPPPFPIFAPRPTRQLAVVAGATSGTANFNLLLLRLPCCSMLPQLSNLPSLTSSLQHRQKRHSTLELQPPMLSVPILSSPQYVFFAGCPKKKSAGKTLCNALAASGIQHWVLAADVDMPSRRRSG
jgi:hypothetical protein